MSPAQRWTSAVGAPMPATLRWPPAIGAPMPRTCRPMRVTRAWVFQYLPMDAGGRRLGNATYGVGPQPSAIGQRGIRRWSAAIGAWAIRYTALGRHGRRLGNSVLGVGSPRSALGHRCTRRWTAKVGARVVVRPGWFAAEAAEVAEPLAHVVAQPHEREAAVVGHVGAGVVVDGGAAPAFLFAAERRLRRHHGDAGEGERRRRAEGAPADRATRDRRHADTPIPRRAGRGAARARSARSRARAPRRR